MSANAPILSVVVKGENVTAADLEEVAHGLSDLFAVVSEELLGERLTLRPAGAHRLCDGCGERAPDVELPSGWAHVGSDDFCAACASSRGAQ